MVLVEKLHSKFIKKKKREKFSTINCIFFTIYWFKINNLLNHIIYYYSLL